MTERSVQHGFTLIELLVAVMIFALLATAGVLLLRGSVSGQAAVRGHLDRLGALQRGLATLDADLAQATPRVSRTQNGTLAPAFFGRAAQHEMPLMQFVRAGWANPGNQRRATLQKVEYWWREDRLERVGYIYVDGAHPPDPSPLADGVTALKMRYRAASGEWRDAWAPARPQDMPVAVELILTRGKAPPLTMRFLVGADAGQPPDPVGAIEAPDVP